jgi:T5SS/PEP-CTERM-associated repeat protein
VDVTIGGKVVIDQLGAVANSVTVKAGGTLVVEGTSSLSVGSLVLEQGATLAWNSGTIEISGGTFTHGSLDLAIRNGALKLVNGATAIIAGNTYVGLEAGEHGTLAVDASSFATGADLFVGFGGAGTLSVSNSATVDAAGLSMNDLGTLATDLTGTIDIGRAELDGTLTVSLNGQALAAGQRFTVLTAEAVTGTFATVNLPTLSGGMGFEVHYTATSVELAVTATSTATERGTRLPVAQD